MADPLETVVQKMIAAGEPEQNIATVIQHYKAQAAKAPTPVSNDEPGTFYGGFVKSIKDQAGEAILNNPLLQGAAHPQTLSDVASLMLAPTDMTRSVATAMVPRAWQAIKAAGQETKGATGVVSLPFRAIQKFSDALPTANETAITKFRGAPGVPASPEPFTPNLTPDVFDRVNQAMPKAAPTAAAPKPAPAFSASELADLQKRGFAPETIQRMAQSPFKRIAAETAPALEPTAPPNAADVPFTQPAHPLQAPRMETGAERVGKPLGMTKEQVREVAGPVLGETPGSASPILPKQALQKIIDDMRALPKDGPERAAYVARATSGKTQWQVENIRRTLEHLGLVVPAAVGAREAITSQMDQGR
jgi:hypothetical protein